MARILVIDDDDQIRTTLRQVLECEGHEVLEALNGKEGLKRFKEDGVDLVITDIIMPEKEGIETIKELREDGEEVGIIAISGGGAIDPNLYVHFAECLGASRSLVKPFSRGDLLQAVDELLG